MRRGVKSKKKKRMSSVRRPRMVSLVSPHPVLTPAKHFAACLTVSAFQVCLRVGGSARPRRRDLVPPRPGKPSSGANREGSKAIPRQLEKKKPKRPGQAATPPRPRAHAALFDATDGADRPRALTCHATRTASWARGPPPTRRGESGAARFDPAAGVRRAGANGCFRRIMPA